MFLSSLFFPPAAAWIAWVLVLGLTIRFLRVIHQHRLAEAAYFRAFPGFVIGLWLLWMLKAGIHDGLDVHILGLTLITLMFGVELAFLGVLVVYVLLATQGRVEFFLVGLNALIVGLAPIGFSAAFHRLMKRKAPNNVFGFIFLSAYLNAILSLLLTLALLSGLLMVLSPHTNAVIIDSLLTIAPILIFPEGFISGGVIAILIMFRPHWVGAYDPDHYLRRS